MFHAYVLTFSKRFFGFDCLQEVQLTTYTKNSRFPLFLGKKIWGEKHISGNFEKK